MEKREERYCNSCKQHVETIVTVLNEGPHHARENCVLCGRFVAFSKKPENGEKRGKNKYLPKDLGINYCQMCLRPENRLGSRGILESHHVIEISSGGPDLPENIWVICTSCHKLINHQRTYLNIHLKDLYSINELREDMQRDRVPAVVQKMMERIFLKREAQNDQ